MVRAIYSSWIVIALVASKSSIAYVSYHRSSPIPRAIITTPSIIPRVVPTIVACITIVPRIVEWIKPRVVPSSIIAITPRISPSPVATTPIVWTYTIIIIEPRIVVAIPTAQVTSIFEILILVDVLLGESCIIIDRIRFHTLVETERDDVVAQGIRCDTLIVTEDTAIAIVLINRSRATRPIYCIDTITASTLLVVSLDSLLTQGSFLLGLLFRIEIEVIVLCH